MKLIPTENDHFDINSVQTQKFKPIQTKKVESFNSIPKDKPRSTNMEFSFELKRINTDKMIQSMTEPIHNSGEDSMDFLQNLIHQNDLQEINENIKNSLMSDD